jgi:CheY-like chemotaxis protein
MPKRKVLLVDGNSEGRADLQRVLELAGYEVALAESGSFVVTMLEATRPDVIVAQPDVQDMAGIELCAIVQADPTTAGIPFLLLLPSTHDDLSPVDIATRIGEILDPRPVPDDLPAGEGAA